MTHNAILLVAGVGRRLGRSDRPKCLLPVAGRPLLDHQLDALRQVGVTHVTLVVGHAQDAVMEATTRHTDLNFTFIRNPAYASSNTLWSLALAGSALADGAWVLNGDVLFDVRVLRQIEQAGRVAALAVDVRPCAEEEVKVLVDEDDRLIALSKDVPPSAALGESVGIACFRPPWSASLARALRARGGQEDHRQSYYEVAIADAAREQPLHIVRLSDAPVIEIDFPEDLVRARDHVAPLLLGASA